MSFILCPNNTVFKPTKNLPFKLLLEAKYGNLTCLCTAALGEEVAKVIQELQNLIRRILKPSNLLCGHHTSHRKMAGTELGATGLVNMRFTLENCILKAVGKRTRNSNSWPTHCLLLLPAPQTLSSGCSREWVKGWSSIKTHLRVHLGYTDVLGLPWTNKIRGFWASRVWLIVWHQCMHATLLGTVLSMGFLDSLLHVPLIKGGEDTLKRLPYGFKLCDVQLQDLWRASLVLSGHWVLPRVGLRGPWVLFSFPGRPKRKQIIAFIGWDLHQKYKDFWIELTVKLGKAI